MMAYSNGFTEDVLHSENSFSLIYTVHNYRMRINNVDTALMA